MEGSVGQDSRGRLIIAAVENSDHGEAAARAAARYAIDLDADLHAVHVVNLPEAIHTLFQDIPLGREEVAAAQRAAVWERIAPVFAAVGVSATHVDLDGVESESVVDYAMSVGADLIVVGNRHAGELRRLFMGSTSSRIIQLAPCNVLVAAAD